MLAKVFSPLSGLWPLPIRICVGIIFAVHGYQKIFVQGIDNVTKFLGPGSTPERPGLGLPLPELMAYLVSYAEFLGGICLILGLFTRYASLALTVVMIVAIFMVKVKVGLIGQRGTGYELDLALMSGCLALLLAGPGPLSLEKLLFKREL
jgi:putative oxidoreductase